MTKKGCPKMFHNDFPNMSSDQNAWVWLFFLLYSYCMHGCNLQIKFYSIIMPVFSCESFVNVKQYSMTFSINNTVRSHRTDTIL